MSKYIASCSFGKDSVAQIILAHEHNEPLDVIVWVEVMFSDTISGENPKHVDFIYNKAIPQFKEWGYEVKVLHSKENYVSCFMHEHTGSNKHPERKGCLRGYPIPYACVINDRCKVKPIKEYNKLLSADCINYVGIAIDEPVRLERVHSKSNQVSLLEKYGYTEKMAMELCRKYGLLSPIYNQNTRGGCWFCPNAKVRELANFYRDYPMLWKELEKLAELPNKISEKFNRTLTFEELEQQIKDYLKQQEQYLSLF